MATPRKTRKNAPAKAEAPAQTEEKVVEVAEIGTPNGNKAAINVGVTQFLESAEVAGQKDRYKAMRAIAFQAFSETLEDVGEEGFAALVERALENVENLPSGWTIASAPRKAKAEVEAEDEEETPKKSAPKRKAAPKQEEALFDIDEDEDEEAEDEDDDLDLDLDEDEEEEAPAPKKAAPRKRTARKRG